MKGVVYYDNFNNIVNRNPDFLDNADMLWLGGYYTGIRHHYRNISDCVNCQVNQKM